MPSALKADLLKLRKELALSQSKYQQHKHALVRDYEYQLDLLNLERHAEKMPTSEKSRYAAISTREQTGKKAGSRSMLHHSRKHDEISFKTNENEEDFEHAMQKILVSTQKEAISRIEGNVSLIKREMQRRLQEYVRKLDSEV